MQPQANNEALRIASGNPYEGRWRWWYAAIADHMLANPTATHKEIAASLGRATNTISMIIITDSFKTYYERRRREYQERLNENLSSKLTRVAEASLERISEVLEKKGDQVPMQLLTDLATKTLDRIGFAPSQTPSVVINQTNVDQSRNVSVSASALEEARATLRQVEAMRIAKSKSLVIESGPQGGPAHAALSVPVEAAEAEEARPLPVPQTVIEDDDAASPLTT